MTSTPGARRRPGRPRAADGPVLRREALLAAAAQAFARGYAQTSVRALARQLGVSLAAVQHHAPTKEALLDAVLAEVVLPQMVADRERLETAAARPAGDPDVRALVLGRIRSLVVHGALVAGVLLDDAPGAAERRRRVLAAVDGERREALAALRRLAEVGVIRPIDPSLWTVVSLFAVPAVGRGLAVLPALGPELDQPPEQVLAGLADLLVRDLLP